MKRYLITNVLIFLWIQSIWGVPLHPELCRRLQQENRLQDVVELYRGAKERGVDKPHPFGRSTIRRFEIPSMQQITREIYDLQGRKIGKFVGLKLPKGEPIPSPSPEHLSSEVYFFCNLGRMTDGEGKTG